jgi:hypothetical protein
MPAFLFASLVLFVIWLALILFSTKTRREQTIMSIVGLVIAPGVLLIVANDFRSTISGGSLSIGIEDLLFTFSLFGVSAVIYHVLLGKHIHKLKGPRIRHPHPAMNWFLHLALILGIWAFISLLFIDIFHIASIRSLIIGGMLIGTYVVAVGDLLFNALVTSVVMAMLVFVTEQLFFVDSIDIAAPAIRCDPLLHAWRDPVGRNSLGTSDWLHDRTNVRTFVDLNLFNKTGYGLFFCRQKIRHTGEVTDEQDQIRKVKEGVRMGRCSGHRSVGT